MAWLRVDDGFTSNGKVVQLTDAEFRCWFRLLCHCAKSKDPSVDGPAIREIAGLTKARVERYADLELLDVVGDAYEIHDWAKYLPKDSDTERQAKWRARKASTETSTSASTSPSTKKPTHVRARADSRPVPSQENPNGFSQIVDTWLGHAPPLIEHRASIRTSASAHRAVTKATTAYGVDDVVQAVVNYANVLGSQAHFFDYRWTLPDFLTRGIHRFVPEARPLENFKSTPVGGRDRGVSVSDLVNLFKEGDDDGPRALPVADCA